MPVMVALSVTIAVAIVAVTVVVAVQLGRRAAALGREAAAAAERLGPLLDELADEAAVTQTELEQLQERTARLRQASDSDPAPGRAAQERAAPHQGHRLH